MSHKSKKRFDRSSGYSDTFSRYFVTKLSPLCIDSLPDTPYPGWSKIETMVSRTTIKAIFLIFAKEVGERARNIDETISFSPKGWENRVMVYFKPNDPGSLHVVVDEEQTGNDYAGSVRLPKPYKI
jgi:hypothetical protein